MKMQMIDPRVLEAESKELRREELLKNFERLTPENQMQVLMLSRKLLSSEEILRRYRKFNSEGKEYLLKVVEAMAEDPRYRR